MIKQVTPRIKRGALRQWLTITLLILLATGGMGYLNGLGRLDLTLYDQLMRANARPARDDIIIVAIDDYSIAQLGRWPWQRSLHARLLNQIMRAKPLAVGFDIIMPEAQQTVTAAPHTDDQALAEALAASKLTVLPVIAASSGAGLHALLPTPDFMKTARAIGHINLELDIDGVARSVFLQEGQNNVWWPHFAVALANIAGQNISANNGTLPGVHKELLATAETATQVNNWQRNYQIQIPFAGSSGHFRSVSYVSVLRGEVPDQFFTGKYVLVGATALGMADAFPTPVSSNMSGIMPGIEINANILAGLLDHKTIGIARPLQTAIFSMLPVLIALCSYLLWAPRIALLMTAILMALTIAASYLALTWGLWIAPAAALIGLIIAYPLWSWVRLESAISYLGQEFILLDQEPHLFPEIKPDKTPKPGEDLLERRINAMRIAARRVRDLRQFISEGLDSLPDATLITTLNGRVLVANQIGRIYFAKIGIQNVDGTLLLDLFSGMSLPHLVQSGEHTFSWWDLIDLAHVSALADGVSVHDQQGHDLLIKSSPCHSARQVLTGWIVSIIDITSIRAAERSRDETLRFLSHDMRAPQASILALLELQGNPSSALPQEQFFARLEQAARKTLGLADNFVQLARAESAEYRLEEVDFQDIIYDAVDEMWILAHNKKIALTTNIDGTEFLTNVDRSLITRAICNLISNAINYSPADTHIECALRLKYVKLLPHIVCSVSDQGQGIAQQDQIKLFQRFQRFNTPGQPRTDGAGLGLVFVKTVVERHFGEITLNSQVGQGTVFTITLPGQAS